MPKFYARNGIIFGAVLTTFSAARRFNWNAALPSDAIAYLFGAAFAGMAMGYGVAYAVWQYQRRKP